MIYHDKEDTETETPELLLHVHCSLNNTIISVTDLQDNVKYWSSPGKVGFKGSRKSGALPIQVATRQIADKILAERKTKVKVIFKGFGRGIYFVVSALKEKGIRILELVNATSFPHNGCRPPKKARR